MNGPQTNTPTKIEYRVVPAERYTVTRYEESDNGAGVVERGHYTSPHVAQEVAYALAKDEHERLGWPPGDERIIYPRHPLDAFEAGEDAVREVSSQAFSVPVEGVLDGARELAEVAVIGIGEDGEEYVSSSMGTPQTLALFARAKKRINELASQ